METHKPKTATINDFREWHSRGELILQPRFQRRTVWQPKAKSYLIDTIIKGFPIPTVYLRQTIDLKTQKTVREVVDGQQRVGSILDFMNNKFEIMSVHNEEFGGYKYADFPDNVKAKFLEYDLSVDFLIGANDLDVLDVFARINSYTVVLNEQEKLNAQFSGRFKQTVFDMGRVHLEFWRKNRILTDNKIMRMDEAALCSDLIIAMIDGIKSKKGIKKYYAQYEDSFPKEDEIRTRFKKTMDIIQEIFGDTLATSLFRGTGLFYSLFCVIYNLMYGLPYSDYPSIHLNHESYASIRKTLKKIENELLLETPSSKYYEFKMASLKYTTDQSKRIKRHKTIMDEILFDLKQQRLMGIDQPS
jgi:hypothetical protein